MADTNKSTGATGDKHGENVVTKTAHTILEKVQSLTEGVKDKAHGLSVTVKEKTHQLTHHDTPKSKDGKKDF